MAFGWTEAIGIGSALLGFVGGERRNSAAQAASQAQMDFQERMSNTAYQRSMKDMRLAGLNPMLAYQQGGASSPGGSTYSPTNVGTEAINAATGGVSSAVATRRATADIKSVEQSTSTSKQEEKTNRQDEYKKGNETMKLDAENSLLWEQRKIAKQEQEKRRLEMKIMKNQIQRSGGAAASAKAEQEFYESGTGNFMRKFELFMKSAIPFFNTAKSAR